EIDEEPYEDRADLQADEDDEEEDLNRVKEESRRRAAKVNSGTPDCQGEGSDTNTGDTPFSLGRSPPQNGNSGVDKTSGTGGLGEESPAGIRKSGKGDGLTVQMGGDPEEVAIKIIRNNDKMYKAGLEELVILKKLVGAYPDDRRHCVRFLSSFKYRNHFV
nr:hypothetical protein [Tanacetum cinerariifolium]